MLREAESLRRRAAELAGEAAEPTAPADPVEPPADEPYRSSVVDLVSRGSRQARSAHPSAVTDRASQPHPAPPEPSPPRPSPPEPAPDVPGPDPHGRRSLFGPPEERPHEGPLALECSTCRRESPVTAGDLLRLSLPFSIHLPLIRRYHSLMRCPACGRITWLRLVWRR